ncbi:DUF305 domain-containing protein [Plantactinospora endophytica]|uniref:DUF305 domain-containing protein n=1 Tax=Plantactinospora endophytica TaxID=673535 RepID=UPI00366E8E20
MVTTASAPEEDEVAGRGSGRWAAGTAALSLAILLGLLLGFTSGLLAPGLFRPGDTSAEAGFARDMSSHHAQAVEMAILAHGKSTNPDIQTLAADIALTQQGQIGVMQTWLKNWGLSPTGRQPRMAWMPDGAGALKDGLMPGMATDAERAELRAATGSDFDLLFLRLMLNHHLGGIHMAEGILDLSDDEQVSALAESMVAGQKKEIELIQTLQGRINSR